MDNRIVYQLESVRQIYPARQVLTIDSLTIERGEFFALVGPSGAGKSTLLRLLALLESPSAGTMRFEHLSANSSPAPLALRRRVAMVFQHPLLLNASVRENVAFGLKMRGERETAARVNETLARLGLLDFERVNARTLSGGEAQRVALARALVLQPDVLLLDEPTANLDPYNVSLIERIVKELHARQGATIVWVTHNVFQARRLATRVGLLLDGRLIEVADTHEFFEAPRDPRTRAFVRGEMIY
jgi:tungstate transport system ATP-binding protein